MHETPAAGVALSRTNKGSQKGELLAALRGFQV
jgi:hypothetical protein